MKTQNTKSKRNTNKQSSKPLDGFHPTLGFPGTLAKPGRQGFAKECQSGRQFQRKRVTTEKALLLGPIRSTFLGMATGSIPYLPTLMVCVDINGKRQSFR
uniref:Uncharacterized protein n=1 Tax=Micrurus surinamensis TaxID=129470 RepID=A0A2D4Q574_MICSU